MVTRESLSSTVGAMARALQLGPSVRLEPEKGSREPVIEVYEPELIHPFHRESPEEARVECHRMLHLLRSNPRARNESELGAAIDNRRSLKAGVLKALGTTTGMAALAGVAHGLLTGNLLEILGAATVGGAVTTILLGQSERAQSNHRLSQDCDRERLNGWARAIETGAPDRMPLYQVAGSGHAVWDAWAVVDAQPRVRELARKTAATGVRAMASKLGQSAPIKELPDALVMGSTRIRKRA